MEYWQLAHLGMRRAPCELTEFELATSFTFSTNERTLIDARLLHRADAPHSQRSVRSRQAAPLKFHCARCFDGGAFSSVS